MIAAIYARKSTAEPGVADDAKSVTRQVENARAFATSKGWTIDDAHVFVDGGQSGAEFERRKGLQRLLGALKPKPPFGVLVVSEQKSLGREQFETGHLIKQLAQAGVEIFEYVHGQSLTPKNWGSPDIKVGRSPGRSDQELCDLGRNRLIHGFFWDLPEQYFLASVDGRLRRPRSGWGACSAAAKSRRKVFNLWLLLDDRWAGDTAQVEPVR